MRLLQVRKKRGMPSFAAYLSKTARDRHKILDVACIAFFALLYFAKNSGSLLKETIRDVFPQILLISAA